jgi:hypothetical protein
MGSSSATKKEPFPHFYLILGCISGVLPNFRGVKILNIDFKDDWLMPIFPSQRLYFCNFGQFQAFLFFPKLEYSWSQNRQPLAVCDCIL